MALSIEYLERGSLIRVDFKGETTKFVVVKLIRLSATPSGFRRTGNRMSVVADCVRYKKRPDGQEELLVASETVTDADIAFWEREGQAVLVLPGVIYDLPSYIT